MAIHLGRSLRCASCNQPGQLVWKQTLSDHSPAPPLFGLAPGGVCPAAFVTKDAVRSYRTLSPLPSSAQRLRRAVCFLWHFPWGRPRRRLSGTVLPRSPDFPPRLDTQILAERPSSLLTQSNKGVSGARVKLLRRHHA